ncbi:MAG: DUF1080 domain-containing protein, partial [Planctomycetaceae bacterium]|nr:DUF1080 domain-containing protein [Planctomycetaceae bacterium]
MKILQSVCALLFFAVCSNVLAQGSLVEEAVRSLPSEENPQRLFNGTDLTGWKGDQQYWSVQDGLIRGANEGDVPSSTYLFTDKSYRNFRLLFAVKQTMSPQHSTMHSAVAILGEKFPDVGENEFGFKGPLVMFCHDWGIWDAHGRNRVVDRGDGPSVENKGDWNLIEVLVTGNRIRCVANGRLIFDHSDDPSLLQESPIGLQLHREKRPQEYHFQGLVLTENPKDTLVTLQSFTQTPEVSPSVLRDAPEEEQQANAAPNFLQGPTPAWVWGPSNDGHYTISTTFSGDNVKSAWVKATCDNVLDLKLNGQTLATSSEWQSPVEVNLTGKLKEGENTLSADVDNQGGVAAFLAKLVITRSDGSIEYTVSDTDWKAVDRSSGEAVALHKLDDLGASPWGNVFSAPSESGVPRDTFVLLPGFQVEKLVNVPKEEFGSWVCITTDPKGRIIASDQGGRGLYRITPGKPGTEEKALVEKLDLNITSAQGLLFAFDSLYINVNGGPGSGLYRAAYDANADTFGEVKKLWSFQGGGEHGPHALRLSPDGKSIYVIAGNHTRPPFEPPRSADPQTMGGVREQVLSATLPEDMTSRILPNWDEDLLLPRMWDANGHARGVLAPGGWIAKTDPDGQTWEIISVGYRNPYDMAFNADGELFAYDADMEWDMGSPWYRPTRVVHATSGSEFGWRSGTGKWPTYYLDSLPPVVNIGPGSPVGVDFGYGTQFPAKYQKALYLCDWTFGTMYAIHLTPDGSSYTGEKEEFLSRTPLPLTDVTIGHDGAMYFTIGGRGTNSELYRVTYTGSEPSQPLSEAQLANQDGSRERHMRRSAEKQHVDGGGQQTVPTSPIPIHVVELVKRLNSPDRAYRFALRTALERVDPDTWAKFVLDSKEPRVVIEGTAALARTGAMAHKAQIIQRLLAVNFSRLDDDLKLDYLRALSLVLIRLGGVDEETSKALVDHIEPEFGTGNSALNLELLQVLVHLQSPTIVSKAVPLLAKADDPDDDISEEDPRYAGQSLYARNRGYGGSIAAMRQNRPDEQKIAYALALRNAKAGWTLD